MSVYLPMNTQQNTYFVIKDSVRSCFRVILTHVKLERGRGEKNTSFFVQAINGFWVCASKMELFFFTEKESE